MLLPLLACAALAPGDSGLSCTEIGCSDGFDLAFHITSTGVWTFDVDLDGSLVTCEAALPLRDSDPDGCDASDVGLVLSGSALPDDQHSIEGMTIARTGLANVGLVVYHERSEVWSGSFAPDWQTVAPNGEACGPVCSSASDTVPVE
jgi:hypothetical protein